MAESTNQASNESSSSTKQSNKEQNTNEQKQNKRSYFNNRKKPDNQYENDFLSDHLREHDHRYNPNNTNPNQRSYQQTRMIRNANEHPQPQRPNNNGHKNKENKSQLPQEPKQSSRSRTKLLSTCSSSGGAVNCICCLHELQTYVYYSCLHFVCLKCAIKMRVICQKTDCPICRQESPRVLCTKKLVESSSLDALINKYASVRSTSGAIRPLPSCSLAGSEKPELLQSENSGIHFEDELIRQEYNDILMSKCGDCGEAFRGFDDLEIHVRRVHKKFYCELCLENLKLFPYERKCYNREDLATHKRVGDKDDHSFKSHPICNYCDRRFFDRDDLYRHYRKEHYYCHFCDCDGHEEYYANYEELRKHFLKTHYLCELDKCSMNAAETHEYVVFRSELDMQAHKKQVHAKTKSEAKTYGKLNIEFNMSRERPPGTFGAASGGSNRNQRAPRGSRTQHVNEAASADYDSESDSRDSREKKTKSHYKEVDANILKMSKEQYERDEEERNKPKASMLISEPVLPPEEFPDIEGATQQATPIWRNMIGQGNAPKLNKETEFPSLKPEGAGPLSALNFGKPGFGKPANVWANKTEPKKQQKKDTKKHEPFRIEPQASSIVPVEAYTTTEIKSKKKSPKKKEEPEILAEKPITTKTEPSPPPGFQSYKPSTVSLGSPPGFSKPPGFDTLPPNQIEYMKPIHYDTRNQTLTSKLTSLFGIYNELEFEKFKQISIQFRTDGLTAQDYLNTCRQLLDLPLMSDTYINKAHLETKHLHIKFLDLVQEMIVLLPDVLKQKQLYEAYRQISEPFETTDVNHQSAKKGGSNKAAEKVGVFTNKLVNCEFCQQYFLNHELNLHQSNFHLKQLNEMKASASSKLNKATKSIEEFPALTTAPVSIKNDLKPAVVSLAQKIQPKSDEDFPSLGDSAAKTPAKAKTPIKKVLGEPEDDFPALSANVIEANGPRYSALPTASLFANPSSHLSLVNKKKHRLQK